MEFSHILLVFFAVGFAFFYPSLEAIIVCVLVFFMIFLGLINESASVQADEVHAFQQVSQAVQDEHVEWTKEQYQKQSKAKYSSLDDCDALVFVDKMHCILYVEASRQGLDPRFAYAVAKQETQFIERYVLVTDAKATSTKGAIGLMQIMPDTGKGECGMSRLDLADPIKNARCGISYLIKMSKIDIKPDGSGCNPALTLARYNAGPGAIRRVDKKTKKVTYDVPDYKETKGYVAKGLEYWYEYRGFENEHSGQLSGCHLLNI